MARILSLTLKNFKGAENVRLDLGERNRSPVITLVGLNESGKTTILEGMSFFVTGDNAVASMFDNKTSSRSLSSLIPIHNKAAFTGDVEISALVQIEQQDLNTASKIAKDNGYEILLVNFPTEITITRGYKFQDSAFVSTRAIAVLTKPVHHHYLFVSEALPVTNHNPLPGALL